MCKLSEEFKYMCKITGEESFFTRHGCVNNDIKILKKMGIDSWSDHSIDRLREIWYKYHNDKEWKILYKFCRAIDMACIDGLNCNVKNCNKLHTSCSGLPLSSWKEMASNGKTVAINGWRSRHSITGRDLYDCEKVNGNYVPTTLKSIQIANYRGDEWGLALQELLKEWVSAKTLKNEHTCALNSFVEYEDMIIKDSNERYARMTFMIITSHVRERSLYMALQESVGFNRYEFILHIYFPKMIKVIEYMLSRNKPFVHRGLHDLVNNVMINYEWEPKIVNYHTLRRRDSFDDLTLDQESIPGRSQHDLYKNFIDAAATPEENQLAGSADVYGLGYALAIIAGCDPNTIIRENGNLKCGEYSLKDHLEIIGVKRCLIELILWCMNTIQCVRPNIKQLQDVHELFMLAEHENFLNVTYEDINKTIDDYLKIPEVLTGVKSREVILGVKSRVLSQKHLLIHILSFIPFSEYVGGIIRNLHDQNIEKIK